MEADLQLLPKRNVNTVSDFKRADKFKFFTNYYTILLNSTNFRIYQYVLDSNVPADSTEILYKMVRSISSKLKQKIGLINFRGNMLWGSKNCQSALHEVCKYKVGDGEDSKEVTVEVIIKQTKQFNINDALKDSQQAAKVTQVLNIDVKKTLRELRMIELGKGKFYDSATFLANKVGQDQDKHNRLSIWKGFKFSICNIQRSLCLQIDVCSRVLRTINFVETMNGNSHDQNKEQFTGALVIARYGNHRCYKIEEICYDKGPKSTFFYEKTGTEITFEQFYKDVYNMKVSNFKQPLLKVVTKIQKQIKDGKIQQIIHYGYLIPEFVSLTGMSDEQRNNRNLMKDVADYTKMTPDQRTEESEKIKKKINQKSNLFQIGKNKQMNGFILDQPDISLKNGSILKPRGGTINLRQEIMNAGQFKDWVFVYSQGKEPKYDDGDADYCVDTIFTAAKTFGIKLKDPGYITVNGSKVDAWISAIEKDIKANGSPQIVVLFLGRYEENIYGPLKRYLTNVAKVPSQGIKKKTVSKQAKSALSAASKIVLQMNAKIGLPLWEVKSKHPYFKEKKTMYCSISLSKGAKGYTLGFVGTTSANSSSIFSETKTGIKRKEDLPPGLLENIFIKWAKNYYMINKEAPQAIIVYREGLSDQQIQKQLPSEIESLQKMVSKFGQKIKKPNYKPELLYVTVDKKINTRFFAPVEKSNNPKLPPKLANPVSGSIILEQLSIQNAFDFYLVPQVVNQGTCTPSHYRVAWMDANMPIEALAEFTFEQCFNYYNWQGAVRVPACMQAADKLSKLVGQYIKEDVPESKEMSNKHYFL